MGKIKDFLLLTSAMGLTASINSYISQKIPEIKSLLEGEDNYYKWKYGDIFYKVKGEGKNLLLLHGLYPGASSYEWIRNFSALSGDFKVYTPDLIGFGQSKKLTRSYRAHLYIKLIFEFIDNVIGEECIIIADYLTCKYAVRNAVLRPERINSLILIAPPDPKSRQTSEIIQLLKYQLMGIPVLSTMLYNVATSKVLTRNLLETKVFNNSGSVTREMVEHYHTCSHQPGAYHVIPSLYCGLLDYNITEDMKSLKQPVWIIRGKNYPSGEQIIENYTVLNPRIQIKMFEHSKLFPHEEEPEEFNKFIKNLYKI